MKFSRFCIVNKPIFCFCPIIIISKSRCVITLWGSWRATKEDPIWWAHTKLMNNLNINQFRAGKFNICRIKCIITVLLRIIHLMARMYAINNWIYVFFHRLSCIYLSISTWPPQSTWKCRSPTTATASAEMMFWCACVKNTKLCQHTNNHRHTKSILTWLIYE